MGALHAAAFGLYLVFMTSWFVRLPERVPALGAIRIDLVVAILIGVLTVAGLPSVRRLPGDRRIFWSVTALAAVVVLTIPLAQWPADAVQYGLPIFAKGIVFYYFSVALVTTRRRLVVLAVVFLGCQAFRVVEPLWLHFFGGYWGDAASMALGRLNRLSSSPYDVANANGFAFVILTFVAFAHYLAPLTRPTRFIYPILLGLSLYALVLTASRTGLICTTVVVVLIWLKSRHRFAMAALVAATLVCAIPLLPADLADRYLSLVDSNTRNARTANDRYQRMGWNLEVALRRPLFGHGIGMSMQANQIYVGERLLAHQVHVEVMEDVGATGLGFFLAFQFCLAATFWQVVMRTRRTPVGDRFLASFVNGLELWFAAVVVFSFAAFGLSTFQWYFLAALVQLADRFTAAEARQRSATAMRRVA